MLDTHGRKFVDPVINKVATILVKRQFTPNQVTILALVLGLINVFLIYFEHYIMACVLLWLSGLLDAVDGAMARKLGSPSPWGTLMDITFDRIVEATIIISLGLKFPGARMELLILTITILISITIFLTVGALAHQRGIKSFYYQAGVMERTEGFILFTVMILCNSYLNWITNIYSLLVIVTIIQRMTEARRIFNRA